MSITGKSCMQFNGYEVNNFKFELTQYDDDTKEFKIMPEFTKSVRDCGDDKYKVQLIFSLNATDENPLPFNMEVAMTGGFTIVMDSENDELKETLLHENTVAIMFPFLRTLIATLTTAANIQPLILPIISLANTFKANEEIK